jgi:hypothetical protein
VDILKVVNFVEVVEVVEIVEIVENMWVQSRLVEGRLVVLAVHGVVAPLQRPRYCTHE